MKVAVNGVELFFDVEGTWLVADGPWMRERPSVVLVPTGPGLDHSPTRTTSGLSSRATRR